MLMTTFSGPGEILDFAIGNEQKAVDFYLDLAGKAKAPAMKQVFEEFADEERGHKAKLMRVKTGKQLEGSASAVEDLKIGDYLVAAPPGAEMTYPDALILAMKQEKAAFRLYSDLAARVTDAALKELLLQLAREEAKHKLRFEVEYDEHVLAEN
jgi:rubrerythrin